MAAERVAFIKPRTIGMRIDALKEKLAAGSINLNEMLENI